MAKNKNLHEAHRAKKDEFYTQLGDIEKELCHYKGQFRDKVVFCNCDDPEYSNFWTYFAMNFRQLGLRKLISTHYNADGSPSYKQEVDAETAIFDEYNEPSFVRASLAGDGDFRSEECIKLLEEADVVVTNPPFSCFREYVAQLMEYGKQFLILGNINAVTYKEIFPLIKDNKIWPGYLFNTVMHFIVPESYVSNVRNENGEKVAKVAGIAWYTNLDVAKRHEELDLVKKYYGHEDEYPTYDNYDAINVDKTVDIPGDYDGVMGVPITFLDKYNPEQFTILGITQRNDDPYKIKRYTKEEYTNANDLNARATIIRDGVPKSCYPRILIQKKGA